MSEPRTSSPAERLATPIQFLPAVGPRRAELLQRLGLRTAADVVFFFPRDYQDMSELRTIDQLVENTPVSVCGVVDDVELLETGPGRSVLGVLLRQGPHYLRATWFNQPFMREKMRHGERLLLSGKPKRRGYRWEMTHPRVQVLGENEEPPMGRILPVYPLTEGIKQSQMRRIVRLAVDAHAGALEEVFPETYLDEHALWPIQRAVREIHRPSGRAELDQARRRFIYQELLVMQLALALRRAKLCRDCRAPALPVDARIHARICGRFPFELTDDQLQVCREIADDMAQSVPMNRLLQGEVGSGKTVVAEYAMLLSVAHGYQAVLMAPTEVLARQHARTLTDSLRASRVSVGLLTGTLPAPERRASLERIASGETQLVVGTHAVLSERVAFHQLGLVVIDEQHKFGVRQRARLRGAGMDPHYLVMTATPIPRTVSMSLFGDLDVSTLVHSPPGRQQVHTYLVGDAKRARWWEFFRKQLLAGRQGYVITPLVEESDSFDLASVEQVYESLVNGELEAFRVDLVHGQQSAEEKEAAMAGFRAGETQVLVATSVVEVGVDVPNATVMTIENGERFGLAQLHQLRGRIGRGRFSGYLAVFHDATSPEAHQRLEAFTRTTNGFELSELDFQMRGPGDLFGDQQHGLPPLRIADLRRDEDLLAEARADAQAQIEEDPALENPAFARLRRMVQTRYGAALDLGDVG